MKNYISIIFCIILLIVVGCSTNQPNENTPKAGWNEDESNISGQLSYTVNPFNEKDSVLCMSNIQNFTVFTHDPDYYQYLLLVLPKYGEVDDSAIWTKFNEYHCACLFNSHEICYIVKDGNFFSIMNSDYTDKVEYIRYFTKTDTISNEIIFERKIHPYTRPNGESVNHRDFYIGDIVAFACKDINTKRFAYEMTTPESSTILCVEGQLGPYDACTGLSSTTNE